MCQWCVPVSSILLPFYICTVRFVSGAHGTQASKKMKSWLNTCYHGITLNWSHTSTSSFTQSRSTGSNWFRVCGPLRSYHEHDEVDHIFRWQISGQCTLMILYFVRRKRAMFKIDRIFKLRRFKSFETQVWNVRRITLLVAWYSCYCINGKGQIEYVVDIKESSKNTDNERVWLNNNEKTKVNRI